MMGAGVSDDFEKTGRKDIAGMKKKTRMMGVFHRIAGDVEMNPPRRFGKNFLPRRYARRHYCVVSGTLQDRERVTLGGAKMNQDEVSYYGVGVHDGVHDLDKNDLDRWTSESTRNRGAGGELVLQGGVNFDNPSECSGFNLNNGKTGNKDTHVRAHPLRFWIAIPVALRPATSPYRSRRDFICVFVIIFLVSFFFGGSCVSRKIAWPARVNFAIVLHVR